MKNLSEHPKVLIIDNKRVVVLTWFNSHSVRDVYENQKRIFELLNLHIDCYFDERLTHSGFMEYSLLNFDSDIWIINFEFNALAIQFGKFKMLGPSLLN